MPSINLINRQGFGSFPVFITSLVTLLGAVLFLQFSGAVGQLGLVNSFLMVLLAHLVTIPTAMALSEVATNQKVEGGGEYFIISRSFGITIGVSIGVALYLSQVILTALYIIILSRAFQPLFDYLLRSPLSIYVYDYRVVSVPVFMGLCLLVFRFGTRLLVNALYVVVPLWALALLLFLFGDSAAEASWTLWDPEVYSGVSGEVFFDAFAHTFPAFCGLTAGLGLSGYLREPRRSLPRGIIGATVVGLLLFTAVVFKLFVSRPLADLRTDELAMFQVAGWGLPLALALGGVSLLSATGSLLMAGRTLQALGADRIFPNINLNRWLAKMNRMDPQNPQPLQATVVSAVLVLGVVLFNNLPVVLEVLSVLFNVTFGSICLISFLEHFAADPAYRPSFRSRWYVSLVGAVTCFVLMFRIDFRYALLFISLVAGTYFFVNTYQSRRQGLSTIFQGVAFQISRRLQIFLQQAKKESDAEHWRPSLICVSTHSFERVAAFHLLRWISYKYGFGTFIHFIPGYLSKATNKKANDALQQLVQMSDTTHSNIYIDTLISPSLKAAISQVVQLPGITGKENNLIMFEFAKNSADEELEDIVENLKLIKATDFDAIVLGSSDRTFGYHHEIDIWITFNDYENASLMILLGYILLGHPDWREANIKILAICPEDELAEQKANIMELINSGRLPISAANVELIAQKENVDTKTIINQKSRRADLTIIGIRSEAVKHNGEEVFQGYDQVGDVLFVNTKTMKALR
jgi:amino acid transporter